MKNSWDDFEVLLINYRDINLSITRMLDAYDSEINDLFISLKNTSFINSHSYFDRLFEIQEKLSKALYKYHYVFSKKYLNFIYDFDRDDDVSRIYWHEKIKVEGYSFE